MEKSLKNYVIGILRSASRKWAPKNEAMKAARIERGKYKCAMCGDIFRPTEVVADHINPVINPNTGWISFDDFIERLFVPVNGYQILCKTCHDIKTQIEDEIRKQKTKDKNEQKKLDKLKQKEENKKKKVKNGTNTTEN